MDMEMNDQLETKAGIPHDAVVTHGELMRAFEAFKETNDERLAGERRGGDVLFEEKLARINASLDAHQRFIDEATLKSARPRLGRPSNRRPPLRRSLLPRTCRKYRRCEATALPGDDPTRPK